MHVFVTGASGWVGSAVVQDLLAAGHEVIGLARSDASARALAGAGAAVHRGDLADPEGLARGAAGADAVVHCAFIHDFTGATDAVGADRAAIEAIGEALAGSGRRFLITSGTGALGTDGPATEDTVTDDRRGFAARLGNEEVALAFAERDVEVSVVRLPPTVHGNGDHGFVPLIVAAAHAHGVSAYLGDGGNRWAAVHRHDAARLYRLALEHEEVWPRLHAIGEEGVPFRAIAEVIGRRLDVPAEEVSPEEAAEHFGFLAGFAGLDLPASGALTQERLEWTPTGPGLLEDLDTDSYYAGL